MMAIEVCTPYMTMILEVTPAGVAVRGTHHKLLNPSKLGFLTCEMEITSKSFETSNYKLSMSSTHFKYWVLLHFAHGKT